MYEPIKLSEIDCLRIERACSEAAQRAEMVSDQMELDPFLKEELIGSKWERRYAVGLVLVTASVSYAFLTWAFDALGIYSFIKGLGLPTLIADHTPAILAILQAALGAWYMAYIWAVPGRVDYFVKWDNAHRRAAVLHDVLEELSDILPGAIPDFSEYAHSWDDDQETPPLQRLFGKRVEQRRTPRPKRRSVE